MVPSPRPVAQYLLAEPGPNRSVMPLGDHREHHRGHPEHHHPAHQRAEDGQNREAEDDGDDYEQGGDAAAQQVIRVPSEVVSDSGHRAHSLPVPASVWISAGRDIRTTHVIEVRSTTERQRDGLGAVLGRLEGYGQADERRRPPPHPRVSSTTSPAKYPPRRRLANGERRPQPPRREGRRLPAAHGDARRAGREFHEALLDAASFEDLPGKWQAAILNAERNRPKLRLVSDD